MEGQGGEAPCSAGTETAGGTGTGGGSQALRPGSGGINLLPCCENLNKMEKTGKRMKPAIIVSSILLLFTLFLCGCISDFTPVKTGEPSVSSTSTENESTSPPLMITIQLYNESTHTSSSYSVPVLLTDIDWEMARGCGFTEDNLQESASLFLDDCQIQQLLRDGWEIDGIGYDMNFIGSRCRISTHPDANSTCDWCLDAGPTLSLRYKGITTVYLADLKDKKVVHYITDSSGNTMVKSTKESDIIIVRNGTEQYTFRNC
jgi:hypothetical protein